MSDDIEDDWAMLRRGPGKAERLARRVSKKTMGFLEFLFTWVGYAWDKIVATIGAVWTRLFNVDFLLTIGVAIAVVGVGSCVYQWVRSDGSIKYCRIEVYSDMYHIKGHVEWGGDVYLDKAKTKDEALAWTKTIGCPIR